MWLRLLALEAVWMGRKGLVEGGLASGMDGLRRTVVDAVRGVTKDVRPLSEAAVSSRGYVASLVAGIDQLEKQIAPPGWGRATSWWR